MNYLHRTDPRFARDDAGILDDYDRRLAPPVSRPGSRMTWSSAIVFRSPYVEPLYTVGYQKRKPPIALHPGRIYLATTAQVYPDVTSWNGSTGLARRVVDQMLAEA